MAQTYIDTRFSGTIQRGFDVNGIPVIPDRIKFNNGFVCAQSGSQDELGEKLDEIVLMILEYGLHTDYGNSHTVAGMTFNQN